MGVLDYLLNNFVMLAEILGLSILLSVSVHVHKRTVLLTRIALLLLFVSSIMIYAERWTQNFETLTIWRPILTAAVYSIQPFILLMMMYVTLPQSKARLWLGLPAVLSIPVYFTSQWTGLVCYFSESNHWKPGPLRYMPYIVFGFYVILFLVQAAIYFKVFRGHERACFFYIALISVFGVALYLAFDFSSDYSPIFSSAILLYYLFLYIHLAKTDPLTGLMNRTCFYRDAESKRQKITGVVSIDMNELKWLNDSLGHDAGDIALKTIGEILSKKENTQCAAYRIGGDEFFLLYFGKTEPSILKDVQEIQNNLQNTPYVCSFGHAIPSANEPLEDVLRRADQMMYENKAELKQRVLKNGGRLHRRHDD